MDINVDDGVVTSLEAKGDGIQSLVALGLRRHILEESRTHQAYIFAIEEPESHLHSDAIYELKKVLNEISETDQLIITTHSGLLTNKAHLESNIIVRKSVASTAKNLADIRKALGIRSHDNLLNAELILLVEGDDDKISLKPILENKSKYLKRAFAENHLIIDSLDGASFLGAKIGLYRGILCDVHCFLDNDSAGNNAISKALAANLISESDYNLALLGGKRESEFEDLLNPSTYEASVNTVFSVNLSVTKSRDRKQKWSQRMADCFRQAGKPFNDFTKMRLKSLVAGCVAEAPETAIASHSEGVIDSLVYTLESKLKKLID